jgi:hypothetical protein
MIGMTITSATTTDDPESEPAQVQMKNNADWTAYSK